MPHKSLAKNEALDLQVGIFNKKLQKISFKREFHANSHESLGTIRDSTNKPK